MPTTKIESLGIYLPERTVTTKEILKSCKNRIWFPLERLTGIKSRRMAGEKEFSIDLARKATSECLELSQYVPEDIELLISCNISRFDKSGSFSYEPSTAIQLKRFFDFKNAVCFDICNACAGMFTAIHIVDGFIKSGMVKRAMVVSGEYITHLTTTAQKEISKGKDDPRLACLTLGDAGAAIILEASSNPEVGFTDMEIFTLGEHSRLCTSQPSTEPHGGCIMNTESVELHRIASQVGVQHTVQMLKSRTRQNPILHFMPHQTASIAILQSIKDVNHSLGLPLMNTRNTINNLKQRGNTATTAHLVALWDKILDSTVNSKDTVLFGIQASGVTLGLAEYTLDDLPDRIRNRERPKRVDESGIVENVHPNGKRLAIGGLGTALHQGDVMADSVALATDAVRSCLEKHGGARHEVDLIVNAGVYRNDFIGEPAMAALIAGEAQLNATEEASAQARTLAYDLGSGACGFLHACQNIQAMVFGGKSKRALCVSSEIENNRKHAPKQILGLKESGCAALLEESHREGFIRFLFKYFPEYHDIFRTEVNWEDNGNPFLNISRTTDMEHVILKHVPMLVEELLAQEELELGDIQVFVPPQLSGAFVHQLTNHLNWPESKVVNLNDHQNYYTCSTVFGLKEAFEKGMVREGDCGLILEAGSGMMLAGALYQF